jgi:hypothetical protein
MALPSPIGLIDRMKGMDMTEVRVTVSMNPLELKLFRRALAKAADEYVLDRNVALSRICELDTLRWDAEDRMAQLSFKRNKYAVSR